MRHEHSTEQKFSVKSQLPLRFWGLYRVRTYFVEKARSETCSLGIRSVAVFLTIVGLSYISFSARLACPSVCHSTFVGQLIDLIRIESLSPSPQTNRFDGRLMGLCAAMPVLPPAAAFFLRPCSSPPRFPSASSSSAGAVFRVFGSSDSVFVRKASSTSRSSSPSSLSTSSYSSSAGAGGDSSDNYASVLRRGPRHLRGEGCRNCNLQTRSSFRTFATMSSEFAESVANNPGLHETPDEATKGYFLQQTMYRIKDPKVSLDFYSRVLGMSLLKRMDFPENKFSLYFVGYEDTKNAPTDPNERVVWTFGKTGTLELTHNWGTESDENFKGHHNGNSDPRGYGHIGVTVDDTYKACERFARLGVKFVKKPDDGKMKGLAFIQDPDGYWIEIFDLKNMSAIVTQP